MVVTLLNFFLTVLERSTGSLVLLETLRLKWFSTVGARDLNIVDNILALVSFCSSWSDHWGEGGKKWEWRALTCVRRVDGASLIMKQLPRILDYLNRLKIIVIIYLSSPDHYQIWTAHHHTITMFVVMEGTLVIMSLSVRVITRVPEKFATYQWPITDTTCPMHFSSMATCTWMPFEPWHRRS